MGSTTEIKRRDARWKDYFDFTSACGRAHNPKDFAINIINNIKRLCSFDQALVYFIDENRSISGQYLMNIDDRWSSMYIGYFANMASKKYSCNIDVREEPNSIILEILDWDNEPSSEFISDYIRARGLRYSCGFALFDLNRNYRTIVSLDRVEKEPFSNDEVMNLKMVIPQLNNLHKNFFYHSLILNAIKRAEGETASLTAREAEIANLLCRGVSTANISRTLFIAQSTTYKHIAHIYEKMNVSSQQELLVRLLPPSCSPDVIFHS